MDTFVKIHEYAVDSLSHHINNIYPHYSSHSITIEPEVNGKLPFLCLCVNVMDDGGTKITIYWKPTHTDQYLKFTSHHLLVHTRYVVRTNRAKLYVTTPDDQQAVIMSIMPLEPTTMKSGPPMSPCLNHTKLKGPRTKTPTAYA